ncbi:ribosome-associated heat shock protein Hsp15 [Chryseobacterium bernardetii]|jgi:ribosome-associated heat shock protein Hsp15|uniref:Ribosome-associated heat shock protein Hsp15 n=3 Tax=Chryseobacterium TaxID=59732 RepID=A0A543E9I6_9FLAO|nr:MULTISPECIES: RNA-binding S4 domain-containing protein [Chryseobacterium]MDR6371840.1 ribosome-associated heat shock protein Hsp15 [Chryseobacterium vietnamense]MDR6443328.1 ribosome-associated heat shock protein Hsp15 [Chryseobacterium bernardetii]MDR6460807.1 ribosome-associated heat shock protein Hsp15 [Chryseobacterium vietnamense]MDR6488513.1 ribosome-associated heat shock protein Hsp15 [Chryseobacterium vietnamense]TQM18255.1 ribosome-associated heat shock protein Hsp15 [Chryseobacter
MRIDKFLWSIRFYKTRSIAAEEIKKNRVSIGTSAVKSSKEVKEGDTIKIRKNQIDYKIKVIQIPKSRIGAKLVPLHIQDVTDKEQYELLKLRKMSQDYYRNKGEGRPTKKDRREMDDYVGNDIDSDFTDWDDFFGETGNETDDED